MAMQIKILLLASLLALGTCPVRAQEISSNGKLSPGASGSSAGLISGGGKVYSNLEVTTTGSISRSRDVSPEVRDRAEASPDTSEEDARKRHLRLKAKKERERESERKLKQQQAAAREMRIERPSGFTTFIAPPYPYRERY
jgi:hypothetical protein